jgi:outer membrane immunogenic protein
MQPQRDYQGDRRRIRHRGRAWRQLKYRGGVGLHPQRCLDPARQAGRQRRGWKRRPRLVRRTRRQQLRGQVGYNLQTGLFVWGIEADIQVSGINQTGTIVLPCCNPTFTGTPASLSILDRLEWFGTVRGRLGLAIWDHTLLYGTGGVIYGEESLSQTKTFAAITYSGINTPIHTGWIGGVGVEYAFANNISAKLEGLFYDMGSQTVVVSTSPLSGFTTTGTFTSNNGAMVRLGANLKFGP